jgi:(R,R)-butanediol dehydrogenase/meso-butanediol dehydrogenase/diacetyl reductase
MLHRIPNAVSFEDAVLVDTMGVALGGIRKSRFRIGDRVLVAGTGAIGLSAVQFLKIGGAGHIIVLQPSRKKRELALEFGADVGLNPIEEGPVVREKVIALSDGLGVDIAYECAGTVQAFQSIIGLVKNGGQVLLLGVNEKATPIVEVELIVREIEMKGSLAYDEDEVRICLDLLTAGIFRTDHMVSDIISLEDIVGKGFERLASSKDLVKVVVAP